MSPPRFWEPAAVMALAVLIDIMLGDPPNRFHPVAWMGSLIAAAKRRAPRGGKAARFLHGLAMAVLGASSAAGLALAAARLLALAPWPVRLAVEAVLLKTSFSIRGLAAAALSVKRALDVGDLPEARRLLSWHLVSRPTAGLDASAVAAATVESVAENASDGIVAPLLFFAVGGLPAAFAYRFLNTMDAMMGYHDPEHEWLGKAPARLDDIANLVPARLTAAVVALAAVLGRADGAGAFRIWRRDGRLTASPNAGHPMAAMAGSLGIELAKEGHYRLGGGLRRAGAADVDRAVRLLAGAAGIGGVLSAVLSAGMAVLGGAG